MLFLLSEMTEGECINWLSDKVQEEISNNHYCSSDVKIYLRKNENEHI